MVGVISELFDACVVIVNRCTGFVYHGMGCGLVVCIDKDEGDFFNCDVIAGGTGDIYPAVDNIPWS